MVYDLLNVGRENALSTEDLCNRLRINQRELRTRIERERKAGLVILSTCSGKGGYFRPANKGEVKDFIRLENKRASSILRNLKSAKRYLRELERTEELLQ